jgi:hypothetical protein
MIITKLNKYSMLPITVEEQWEHNNRIYGISKVKNTFFSDFTKVIEETNTFVYYLNNKGLMGKNVSFVDGNQIRVMFNDSNSAENIEIEIKGTRFKVKPDTANESFAVEDIISNKFCILKYVEPEPEEISDEEGNITYRDEEPYFVIENIEGRDTKLYESNYNYTYNCIKRAISYFEHEFGYSVLQDSWVAELGSVKGLTINLPKHNADIKEILYTSPEILPATQAYINLPGIDFETLITISDGCLELSFAGTVVSLANLDFTSLTSMEQLAAFMQAYLDNICLPENKMEVTTDGVELTFTLVEPREIITPLEFLPATQGTDLRDIIHTELAELFYGTDDTTIYVDKLLPENLYTVNHNDGLASISFSNDEELWEETDKDTADVDNGYTIAYDTGMKVLPGDLEQALMGLADFFMTNRGSEVTGGNNQNWGGIPDFVNNIFKNYHRYRLGVTITQ